MKLLGTMRLPPRSESLFEVSLEERDSESGLVAQLVAALASRIASLALASISIK